MAAKLPCIKERRSPRDKELRTLMKAGRFCNSLAPDSAESPDNYPIVLLKLSGLIRLLSIGPAEFKNALISAS